MLNVLRKTRDALYETNESKSFFPAKSSKANVPAFLDLPLSVSAARDENFQNKTKPCQPPDPGPRSRRAARSPERSHAGRDGAGAPRRRRCDSAPLSSRGRALQDLHLPRGPSCRLHCCSPFPTPHVLALGLQDLLDLFEHCLGLFARRAPVVIQCELALRRAARIQTDAGVGACERYVVRVARVRTWTSMPSAVTSKAPVPHSVGAVATAT